VAVASDMGHANRRVRCTTYISADSDEAGQAFQYEAGHPYRSEAGHGSDLKPAKSSPRVVLDDGFDLGLGQALRKDLRL
jgi:hypothetical protein